MNYPLISEYVEAIKMAEDNFEELSYLRPVLDADGQLVMSSGNPMETGQWDVLETVPATYSPERMASRKGAELIANLKYVNYIKETIVRRVCESIIFFAKCLDERNKL